MEITIFSNARSVEPCNVTLSWDELCEMLPAFMQVPVHRTDKLNHHAMIFGRCEGKRSNANVRFHSGLAADFDLGPDDPRYLSFEAMCGRLEADGLAFIAYTTTKSTTEHNKFRVLMPYAVDVPRAQCLAAWRACYAKFGGAIDDSTKDEARLSFLPADWTGEQFFDHGRRVASTISDPFNGLRINRIGAPILSELEIASLMTPLLVKETALLQPQWSQSSAPSVASDPLTPREKAMLARGNGPDALCWPMLANLVTSPLVSRRMLQQLSQRHGARDYNFMCRVAVRAASQRLPINAATLTKLAEQFSRDWLLREPPHDAARQAENALAWALRTAEQSATADTQLHGGMNDMDPNTLAQIQAAYGSADWTAVDLTSLFSSLQPDDRVAQLRAWAGKQAGGGEDFRKRFDDAHCAWLADALIGGWPESVTDMVALYMEHRRIAVWFDGTMTSAIASAETLNLETVSCDLRLAARRVGLPYRDSAIADALSKHLRKAKDARLSKALELLDGQGAALNETAWDAFVVSFVDATAGKGSVLYAKRVLQTTVWQVLRRLANDPAHPVEHHLMAILCGPQGAGKSSLVRKLFEPIADLVASSDFKSLTDGRDLQLPLFPVVFIDEMENAERSDVEAIKNAITRNTVTARIMRTNDNTTVRSRNVFVGATNGTLADKISDTTGQRRFGPIQTRHAPTPSNIDAGLPVVDWEALNAVDMLALWRSVDWRAPHPLQTDDEAKAEWQAIIEGERNQDSVEAWLRQFDVGDLPSSEPTTTNGLYTLSGAGYRDWCKEHGLAAMAVGRFGRALKTHATGAWYPFLKSRETSRGTIHEPKRKRDEFGQIFALKTRQEQERERLLCKVKGFRRS